MWGSVFPVCLQGKDHAVRIPEFPVPRSWPCSGNSDGKRQKPREPFLHALGPSSLSQRLWPESSPAAGEHRALALEVLAKRDDGKARPGQLLLSVLLLLLSGSPCPDPGLQAPPFMTSPPPHFPPSPHSPSSLVPTRSEYLARRGMPFPRPCVCETKGETPQNSGCSGGPRRKRMGFKVRQLQVSSPNSATFFSNDLGYVT